MNKSPALFPFVATAPDREHSQNNYLARLGRLTASLLSSGKSFIPLKLFFQKPLMISMIANIMEKLQYSFPWFLRGFDTTEHLPQTVYPLGFLTTYCLVFRLSGCFFWVFFTSSLFFHPCPSSWSPPHFPHRPHQLLSWIVIKFIHLSFLLLLLI